MISHIELTLTVVLNSSKKTHRLRFVKVKVFACATYDFMFVSISYSVTPA
jgi:hypothetical protein